MEDQEICVCGFGVLTHSKIIKLVLSVPSLQLWRSKPLTKMKEEERILVQSLRGLESVME